MPQLLSEGRPGHRGRARKYERLRLPQCGVHSDLFGAGGGQRLAEEMSVPFLGRIPIDPRAVGCGDAGTCILDAHPDSPAAEGYLALARSLDGREELWNQAEPAAVASSGTPR